jgi:hypothetical protein
MVVRILLRGLSRGEGLGTVRGVWREREVREAADYW